MSGRCPKCDATVLSVDIEYVEVENPQGRTFKGASYSCQSCHAVLSVEIDPLALKTDIVTGIAKALQAR